MGHGDSPNRCPSVLEVIVQEAGDSCKTYLRCEWPVCHSKPHKAKLSRAGAGCNTLRIARSGQPWQEVGVYVRWVEVEKEGYNAMGDMESPKALAR